MSDLGGEGWWRVLPFSLGSQSAVAPGGQTLAALRLLIPHGTANPCSLSLATIPNVVVVVVVTVVVVVDVVACMLLGHLCRQCVRLYM